MASTSILLRQNLHSFTDFFKFPSEEEIRKKAILFSDFELTTKLESPDIDSNDSSPSTTEQDENDNIEESRSIQPLAFKQFRRRRRTEFYYEHKSPYDSTHPTPIFYNTPIFTKFPEKVQTIPNPPLNYLSNTAGTSIINTITITHSTPPKSFSRKDSYSNFSGSESISSPIPTQTYLQNISGTPISSRRPPKRTFSQMSIEDTNSNSVPENAEDKSPNFAKKIKKESTPTPTPTPTSSLPPLQLPQTQLQPLLQLNNSSDSLPIASPKMSAEEEIQSAGLVPKIAKAIKTLGRTTGGDITNWICEKYSDVSNKKKMVYTVNAMLSSKKHSNLFIKETVHVDGNKRAFWTLGEIPSNLHLDSSDSEPESKSTSRKYVRKNVKEENEEKEDEHVELTEEEEKQKLNSFTFKSNNDNPSDQENETDGSEDDNNNSSSNNKKNSNDKKNKKEEEKDNHSKEKKKDSKSKGNDTGKQKKNDLISENDKKEIDTLVPTSDTETELKPLSARRKNKVMEEEEDQGKQTFNDLFLKKILRNLGTVSDKELFDHIVQVYPKLIITQTNWKEQIQNCLENNNKGFFIKEDVNWKLSDDDELDSSSSFSSSSEENNHSPSSPKLKTENSSSEKSNYLDVPKRRKDRILSNSPYQFVDLIEEALAALGKATGADITQWIATHYSDLEPQIKSLGYSVNAILSSKKYKTIFLKHQMVSSPSSSRTLWKLSQNSSKYKEIDI